METLERKAFLTEVRLQCNFALEYFKELVSLPGPREEPFFRAAHSFLLYAANVARLLWPHPRKLPGENRHDFKRREQFATERGKDLRKFLSLPDNGADHVLGSRSLRNRLEHFDLYLDQFLQEKKPDFFADLIVKPNFTDFDVRPESCIRFLAMADVEFMFLGAKFPLKPLAEALAELRKTADDVLKSPDIYR